ncbi:MAG: DUF1080 domain-containing protein [Verrucomicrobiae bacterium]|nr:DUF1080 domain-containing protein [Verrucomicrobiae bacterium]
MFEIRLLIPFVSLLALAGCTQKENSQSVSANEAGFVSLFDGKSLAGWRGYMEDPAMEVWSVQDGVIVSKSASEKRDHANLMTVAEFDDFDLRWEWKIEEGANSGVIFHVKEGPDKPYKTGPEYQILDNQGFRSGKGEPVSAQEYTAGHYAIEAPLQDATKPIGEWNSSRILVVGNSVTYWLNGVKTAEYEMHSDKWNKQVAGAKFAKWPEYGMTGSGHIVLQDHGHAAAFRTIRIKDLSKS